MHELAALTAVDRRRSFISIVAIGTVFTLFVVPGVYMLIGATHSRENFGAAIADAAPSAR